MQRFVDRSPEERNITVYSNCSSVKLVLNGADYAEKPVADHVAVFENVELQDGEKTVSAVGILGDTAISGNTIVINAVEESNPDYALPKDEAVAGNWFDDIRADRPMEFIDGYFSIKDKIGEMLDHPEACIVVNDLFEKAFAGMENGKDMQKNIEMCRNMALEPLLTIMKAAKGTDAYLNDKLNKIRK